MHSLKCLALAGCLVIALCSMTAVVFAQSGGPYDLTWHNIGPGGASSGGNFTLNAAIGQPDAGTMSGGNYTLSGGFLPAGPACTLTGDLNGDGDLDIQDIVLVTAQFGDAC